MGNIYHVTVNEVWKSVYAVKADNIAEASRKACGGKRISHRYLRLLPPGTDRQVFLYWAGALPACPNGAGEKGNGDGG